MEHCTLPTLSAVKTTIAKNGKNSETGKLCIDS